MAHSSSILTRRAVTLVSFILAVYVNFKYLIGTSSHLDNKHTFHTGHTPFTANVFFLLTYWIIQYAFQIAFLAQFYSKDNERVNLVSDIGWHFTVYNLLHLAWSYLFARGHFVWSELVIVANLFNILILYVTHKTYAIRPKSSWFLIHVSTAVLPWSWLLYAVFWNGAVAVHAHGFAARILANVFIWDFLLVPVMFLLLYRDWAIGLSTSFLVWGLGVGQFFTKAVALQWIFAFIIAALDFVFSVIIAIPDITPSYLVITENTSVSGSEQAPLLGEA